MKIRIWILIALMFLVVLFGFLWAYMQKETTISKQYDTLYDEWKDSYVQTVTSGTSRVIDPSQNNATVSEGIGYGMLFAVMHDDKQTFDELYSYAKLYENENGFMNWKISKTGNVASPGGATDAEEDIAYALYLANLQWNKKEYLSDAMVRIKNIQTYLISEDNLLLPGDDWGNTDAYNPSYVAPEYYLVFYELTKDSRWLDILRTNVTYLEDLSDSQTGLLPNWVNFDTDKKELFGYESVRVPIRFYQFLKNKELHTISDLEDVYQTAERIMGKEADFAGNLDYNHFLSEYSLDGKLHADYQNNTFLSARQAILFSAKQINKRDIDLLTARSSEDYFGDALRLWCMSLYQNSDQISQ